MDLVSSSVNESGCTCHRCGDIYRVDVIVPDELWKKVSNSPHEMLCGECIMLAIESLGEFSAYRMVSLVDGGQRVERLRLPWSMPRVGGKPSKGTKKDKRLKRNKKKVRT